MKMYCFWTGNLLFKVCVDWNAQGGNLFLDILFECFIVLTIFWSQWNHCIESYNFFLGWTLFIKFFKSVNCCLIYYTYEIRIIEKTDYEGKTYIGQNYYKDWNTIKTIPCQKVTFVKNTIIFVLHSKSFEEAVGKLLFLWVFHLRNFLIHHMLLDEW